MTTNNDEDGGELGRRRDAIADARGLDVARARVEASRQRGEERARRRRERWGDSDGVSMTRLCRSFPSLANADGIEPWAVERFVRWSDGPQLTGGMVVTIRFVLQVWNAHEDWSGYAAAIGVDGAHLAPFNVVEAFGRWDDAHRDAFMAWCDAPFFP